MYVFINLTGVGLTSILPCISPLRGRCAPQIVCPDDLSNQGSHPNHPLQNKKGTCIVPFLFWRRGWDSNPRRAINPCRFSRPVHSTALPPLQSFFFITVCTKFESRIQPLFHTSLYSTLTPFGPACGGSNLFGFGILRRSNAYVHIGVPTFSRSPLPARLYRLHPCNRTSYIPVVVPE